MNKILTHGEKLRLAGIKRHGSEKAWLEYTRKSGAKGGKAKGPGGFGHMKKHDPERLKQVGETGRNSRWGKQRVKD